VEVAEETAMFLDSEVGLLGGEEMAAAPEDMPVVEVRRSPGWDCLGDRFPLAHRLGREEGRLDPLSFVASGGPDSVSINGQGCGAMVTPRYPCRSWL